MAFSPTDLRIVSALYHAPRASAADIAAVLRLSPHTVTRRVTALLADGAVKVSALPPVPTGARETVLRIKVARRSIDVIADALAARTDVTSLDISSNGDELIAIVESPSTARSRLLWEVFEKSDTITEITTDTILHVYKRAADWKYVALEQVEIDELLARHTPPTPLEETFDEAPDRVDHAITEALEKNGRLSLGEIARATSIAKSTVRRRFDSMQRAGRLRFQANTHPEQLGYTIDADIMLTMPPGQLDAAGRLLTKMPATHAVFATTGKANLHAAVWCRTIEELYTFITDGLADLGATALETLLIGDTPSRQKATTSAKPTKPPRAPI